MTIIIPANTISIYYLTYNIIKSLNNRYYIRGLCRKAIADGGEIEAYRAKNVNDPRPESQALIGTEMNANQLLEDLRTHNGVDTALGLPSGPNSGISARIRN